MNKLLKAGLNIKTNDKPLRRLYGARRVLEEGLEQINSEIEVEEVRVTATAARLTVEPLTNSR